MVFVLHPPENSVSYEVGTEPQEKSYQVVTIEKCLDRQNGKHQDDHCQKEPDDDPHSVPFHINPNPLSATPKMIMAHTVQITDSTMISAQVNSVSCSTIQLIVPVLIPWQSTSQVLEPHVSVSPSDS